MRDDRVYLGHLRDAISDIEQYTSAGRDAFMAERMRQDAVIRKLEIIGDVQGSVARAVAEGRRPRVEGHRHRAVAGVSRAPRRSKCTRTPRPTLVMGLLLHVAVLEPAAASRIRRGSPMTKRWRWLPSPIIAATTTF